MRRKASWFGENQHCLTLCIRHTGPGLERKEPFAYLVGTSLMHCIEGPLRRMHLALCTMPRGQSSGHRALAHLLATLSIATPKQAKEPILTTRNGGQLDGQEKGIRTEYFSTCH